MTWQRAIDKITAWNWIVRGKEDGTAIYLSLSLFLPSREEQSTGSCNPSNRAFPSQSDRLWEMGGIIEQADCGRCPCDGSRNLSWLADQRCLGGNGI